MSKEEKRLNIWSFQHLKTVTLLYLKGVLICVPITKIILFKNGPETSRIHQRSYLFTIRDVASELQKLDAPQSCASFLSSSGSFFPNRKMSWWSSNQSNMINGTDGAVFHPLINRNELLYIFAADLCRCVRLCGFKFV